MKPENYTHYEVDESCKELDKLLQRELIQAKVEIKQPLLEYTLITNKS